MRRLAALLVVLAGCGGSGKPAPTPAATPVEATATPAGPWSVTSLRRLEPLPCPVSSTRGAERQLALGGGETADAGEVTATLPGRNPYVTGMACAADGRLAVAWIETRGETARAYVAQRPRDGRLGRPILLGRAEAFGFEAGIDDVALAFAPDGELLAAWSEIGRARAVTFSPAGRRGTPVTLGKALEVSEVAVEIGAGGRAVVAWASHDTGLQVDFANRLRAAFREPGGLFGPAQLVHVGSAVDPDDGQPTDVRLAVAPDGRALLQWSDITGSYARGGFKYPIRVAEAEPHGRFGRSVRLTRNGRAGAVALGADGTALAAWPVKDGIRVAFHAAGEPFGRPETVSGRLIEATRRLGSSRLVLTAGDAPIGAEIRSATSRLRALSSSPGAAAGSRSPLGDAIR